MTKIDFTLNLKDGKNCQISTLQCTVEIKIKVMCLCVACFPAHLSFSWAHLNPFKPLWAQLNPFESNWTYLNPFETILTYLSNWTHLKQLDPIKPLWIHFNSFEPIWTYFNQFQPIWTHLNPFEFTVWNFHDYSNIQILREINFEDSRSAKWAILPHL